MTINKNSELELMKRYLNGDEAAFAEIYQLYAGKVYAYLSKKIRNREEKDEVFQKVFMKFHTSRRNYQSEYPLLQWLYVVAKTTLIDHIRSQNRQLNPTNAPVNEELSQNTPSDTLKDMSEIRGIETLSQDQKMVIEMKVLEEKSYDQIASALNQSQQNVRQLFSRAIKKLKGFV